LRALVFGGKRGEKALEKVGKNDKACLAMLFLEKESCRHRGGTSSKKAVGRAACLNFPKPGESRILQRKEGGE